MKKKNILLSIIFCFAFVILSGCNFPFMSSGDWPTSTESEYQNPITITATDSLSDMAENLMNSCVTVAVVNSLNAVQSFGSGVAVYAGGYIATNYHVVSTYIASPLSYSVVAYTNGDMENSYLGKVLWYDAKLDVAIIQIKKDLPYVNMKDRAISPAEKQNLRILEQVIAIGTPLDFSLQNWCTTGTVSKLNCYTTSDGNLYEMLIGHTSPINHGNSGGALFDLSGNLIGLNTLGNDDAHSIFFAVPIYPVMLVIDKVVELNEKDTPDVFTTPLLGVSGYDKLHADLADINIDIQTGFYAESVSETGVCAGKILAGDTIIKLTNNLKTFDIANRNMLSYALISSNKGETITVTVLRNKTEIQVNITL